MLLWSCKRYNCHGMPNTVTPISYWNINCTVPALLLSLHLHYFCVTCRVLASPSIHQRRISATTMMTRSWTKLIMANFIIQNYPAQKHCSHKLQKKREFNKWDVVDTWASNVKFSIWFAGASLAFWRVLLLWSSSVKRSSSLPKELSNTETSTPSSAAIE